jgi:hypothetical protein
VCLFRGDALADVRAQVVLQLGWFGWDIWSADLLDRFGRRGESEYEGFRKGWRLGLEMYYPHASWEMWAPLSTRSEMATGVSRALG